MIENYPDKIGIWLWRQVWYIDYPSRQFICRVFSINTDLDFRGAIKMNGMDYRIRDLRSGTYLEWLHHDPNFQDIIVTNNTDIISGYILGEDPNAVSSTFFRKK